MPEVRDLLQRTYLIPNMCDHAYAMAAAMHAFAIHGDSLAGLLGACADGIINAMPFSCMAGIIASGLAVRLRRDYDNVPWLDLSYDLQRTTNLQTRLEAFMDQAAHRQARRLGHGDGRTRIARTPSSVRGRLGQEG